MTTEYRIKLDDAVKYWMNVSNDELLSLLIDYAKDVGFYHDNPSMREHNEINVRAIEKVLRERLGETK